jgi:hypothetical protein
LRTRPCLIPCAKVAGVSKLICSLRIEDLRRYSLGLTGCSSRCLNKILQQWNTLCSHSFEKAHNRFTLEEFFSK